MNLNLSNNNNSTERIADNSTKTIGKKRAVSGFFRKNFRKKKKSTKSIISDGDGDWDWGKYNDNDVESERPRRRKSESSEESSKHYRRRLRKSRVEEESSSSSSASSASSASSSESSNESSIEENVKRRRKPRVEVSSSSERSDDSSIEEKRSNSQTALVLHRGDSSKRIELREKRRRIESWHENEKERSRRNNRPLGREPEESVRKARVIMADYDERKEGNGATQLSLVTDIGQVLKLLEEDRQKTENRLREVETEAKRLKIERDASSQKVSDLKASQHNAELNIEMEQLNIDTMKAGTKETVCAKKEENMQLTLDLDATRQEREEMLDMIELLKKAQTNLASNANFSQGEVAKLEAQKKRKSKELILLEIAPNAGQMKCSTMASELESLEGKKNRFEKYSSDISECAYEEHSLSVLDKIRREVETHDEDTDSVGSWSFAGDDQVSAIVPTMDRRSQSVGAWTLAADDDTDFNVGNRTSHSTAGLHPATYYADSIDRLRDDTPKYNNQRHGNTSSDGSESGRPNDKYHRKDVRYSSSSKHSISRKQKQQQHRRSRSSDPISSLYDNKNPGHHDGQVSEWYSNVSKLDDPDAYYVPRNQQSSSKASRITRSNSIGDIDTSRGSEQPSPCRASADP